MAKIASQLGIVYAMRAGGLLAAPHAVSGNDAQMRARPARHRKTVKQLADHVAREVPGSGAGVPSDLADQRNDQFGRLQCRHVARGGRLHEAGAGNQGRSALQVGNTEADIVAAADNGGWDGELVQSG